MRRGRVIVVGSVNVDLVATVERLPAPGETVIGGSFSRHHGGKGGNQATAAARLGARVAFVGAVGDDPFADEARAALGSEGIDVSELATIEGPTGVALILVDAHGENLIAVAPGANASVTAEQVIAALERARLRPVDVVLVSNEIPIDAVRAALREGRRAGATTILNPGPATGLDSMILASTDILVPNEGEVEQLIRGVSPGRGSGAALLLAGPAHPGVSRAVIVTLGAGGALLVRGDAAAATLPAADVHPVDTVGAGDTFVGSLAADLAADRGIAEAAARAVAAAGLSTTKPGARNGMPTAAELERFLGPGARPLGG